MPKKLDRKEQLHASAREHRHFGRSIIANGVIQRSWDRTPTCRVWYPHLNGEKVTIQNYALCKLCKKPFLLDSSGTDICGRIRCQLAKVMLGIRQISIDKVSGEPIVTYNSDDSRRNSVLAFDEHPVFLVDNRPKKRNHYKRRFEQVSTPY